MYSDLDVHTEQVMDVLMANFEAGKFIDYSVTLHDRKRGDGEPLLSVITLYNNTDGRRFRITVTTSELE